MNYIMCIMTNNPTIQNFTENTRKLRITIWVLAKIEKQKPIKITITLRIDCYRIPRRFCLWPATTKTSPTWLGRLMTWCSNLVKECTPRKKWIPRKFDFLELFFYNKLFFLQFFTFIPLHKCTKFKKNIFLKKSIRLFELYV